MKYSVLMAVYKKDSPKYLNTALESIYDQQTRKPDEIVVVFDGPLTEDLYKVLDDFKRDKESIVKYYLLEKNMGLGEALRAGTEQCSGDYIFRMDSDDISERTRFEKQIKYLENHPEIDVVGTDIAEFETSLNETMRLRICPEKHENIIKMAKRRSPMNHVSVCMKKEALIKCGGYGNVLLLEDYYLWLKMIVAGCHLANIHETLVWVRIGNGFDLKRGSKERIYGWKILQKYMLEHKLINKFEAIINMAYIYIFVNFPPGLKKVLYDKLLRKKCKRRMKE